MQEYYVWCIFILLLQWKDVVTSTFGKTCLPSYHKFITNQQTYKILKRKDFDRKNSTGNFLPMILDKKSNRLIIGAKDYIFYVNDTTLEKIEAQYWRSDQQKISSCQTHGTTPKDYCANYIHFLAIHQGKLFVCGTNSLVPKYKIISLESLSTLKEKIAYGICSLRRDFAMVGDITGLGQLISGNYKDFYTNPVVSGTFVFNERRQHLITNNNWRVFFNQPEFISSVSVGDSVYFFLMEKAIEDKNRNTGTVVRLCTGDNGGSRLVGENMWTTLRKSRLVCNITKNYEKFHFENLVDVVYNEKEDLFYASYTMFKHLNLYSAVCTFLRKDVDQTFSGKFLETRKGPHYLQPVDNGNFLFGCKVNPANLSGSADIIDGKQPTNRLDRKALAKAKQYDLMESKVYHQPNIFEFMQTSVSFNRLALVPVSGRKQPVLYIGTNSGNIFMVYKNTKSTTCIIKEILTNIGKVQRLLINEDKRILYASSDTNVISLNIDYCHIYQSEKECVQAHNPLCGWSLMKKLCVATWNDQNVRQDLTTCPKRSDFFSSWSKWSTCEYSSSKFCRCRSRSCYSCDTSLCKNGHFMEVKDCTVNPVDDVSKWQKEGSINGGWSDWLMWSNCNVSKCGNNTMSRIRTCTSPKPSNGGRKCLGDSIQCKSCPKKLTVIDIIWSGWSGWGECMKIKDVYVMNCTRTCSKPNSCPGSSIKKLPCAPDGIEWSSWSACSCQQRVRHRYPTLINDCGNCLKSIYPQYNVCECLSSTEVTTTTKEVTTPPTVATTTKICTPVPSSKAPSTNIPHVTDRIKLTTKKANTTYQPLVVETSLNTDIHVVTSAPQTNHQCDTDNKFTLKNLIIIITIVVVTCFLIFGLIIYLILRRKHNEKVLLNGRTNSSDRTPLRNFNVHVET